MSAIPPKVAIGHTIDAKKLQGPQDRVSDLRPVWINDVQPLVTEYLTQRFDSQGAHLGTPWAPHAPATIELRKRPGHGRGGIGRDTNRMWASFVKSAGSSPAPGGVLRIEPTRYERGSSVPHALFFQLGYKSKTKPVQYRDSKSGALKWTFVRRQAPKQIPARPIITDPLPPSLVEAIELSVAAYLSGGVQ